jgi:hypothetical protein
MAYDDYFGWAPYVPLAAGDHVRVQLPGLGVDVQAHCIGDVQTAEK